MLCPETAFHSTLHASDATFSPPALGLVKKVYKDGIPLKAGGFIEVSVVV